MDFYTRSKAKNYLWVSADDYRILWGTPRFLQTGAGKCQLDAIIRKMNELFYCVYSGFDDFGSYGNYCLNSMRIEEIIGAPLVTEFDAFDFEFTYDSVPPSTIKKVKALQPTQDHLIFENIDIHSIYEMIKYIRESIYYFSLHYLEVPRYVNALVDLHSEPYINRNFNVTWFTLQKHCHNYIPWPEDKGTNPQITKLAAISNIPLAEKSQLSDSIKKPHWPIFQYAIHKVEGQGSSLNKFLWHDGQYNPDGEIIQPSERIQEGWVSFLDSRKMASLSEAPLTNGKEQFDGKPKAESIEIKTRIILEPEGDDLPDDGIALAFIDEQANVQTNIPLPIENAGTQDVSHGLVSIPFFPHGNKSIKHGYKDDNSQQIHHVTAALPWFTQERIKLDKPLAVGQKIIRTFQTQIMQGEINNLTIEYWIQGILKAFIQGAWKTLPVNFIAEIAVTLDGIQIYNNAWNDTNRINIGIQEEQTIDFPQPLVFDTEHEFAVEISCELNEQSIPFFSAQIKDGWNTSLYDGSPGNRKLLAFCSLRPDISGKGIVPISWHELGLQPAYKKEAEYVSEFAWNILISDFRLDANIKFPHLLWP
jgi:hypothetical protein